ncbi:MAG: hypothetical protein SGARI_002625 [Bacillariaceae sp.]
MSQLSPERSQRPVPLHSMVVGPSKLTVLPETGHDSMEGMMHSSVSGQYTYPAPARQVGELEGAVVAGAVVAGAVVAGAVVAGAVVAGAVVAGAVVAGAVEAGVATGQTVLNRWTQEFNERHQLYPAEGIHPCSSRSLPGMIEASVVGAAVTVGEVVENLDGAAEGGVDGTLAEEGAAVAVGVVVENLVGADDGAEEGTVAVVGPAVVGPVVLEAVEGATDGAAEGKRLADGADDGAALGNADSSDGL